MDRDLFINVSNLDLIEPNQIGNSIDNSALDCYLLTF